MKIIKEEYLDECWQHEVLIQDKLDELDFIICDEVHRFAASVPGEIVKKTLNCKYKWGFTGTLPEDPVMKMELLGKTHCRWGVLSSVSVHYQCVSVHYQSPGFHGGSTIEKLLSCAFSGLETEWMLEKYPRHYLSIVPQ